MSSWAIANGNYVGVGPECLRPQSPFGGSDRGTSDGEFLLLRRRHVVGKIKTIDKSSKHQYLEGLMYVVPLDVPKLLNLLKVETWSEVRVAEISKMQYVT